MELRLVQRKYNSEMKLGVELPIIFDVEGWPYPEQITVETATDTENTIVDGYWIIKRDGKPDPDRYETTQAAKEKLEAEIKARLSAAPL